MYIQKCSSRPRVLCSCGMTTMAKLVFAHDSRETPLGAPRAVPSSSGKEAPF